MQLDELARRIAAHGLCAAQFAAVKSIPDFDPDAGRVSPGLATHAREAFRAEGVSIAVLGCYINLGTPDEADARFQMGRFKEYLRHARDFGCGMVGTETGSVRADFVFHPDNHGEAAFQRVLSRVRELVREAEKFGVFVAVEGVTSYVVNSPRRIKRLIDEVGSNNLQIIFDPVNLVNADNHKNQDAIIEESFALFGERIAAFHAKDFVITPEGEYKQVAAGTAGGLLNYPLFFKLAKQHKPWAYVLLEDTNPETLARTVAFAREAWERA
ncbi:L-ribulose-5-phosphate 3-epimerase [Ereboglobus sp. PH5-10]|uniref:sugar phosphate isomerase/epimerase family protein n=1 Tax=Ereboglobus sp. PH5-10 TaxID=2940629 RepID=UPI0024049311|nr:sugar phosphate isomerase/epimerase family protein [Ereboglobus sp. PH5-10]MDF9826071.1 L-ribulose-5-phosphate 3-epimerase [Ereboglobus sp. PH5-10]